MRRGRGRGEISLGSLSDEYKLKEIKSWFTESLIIMPKYKSKKKIKCKLFFCAEISF